MTLKDAARFFLDTYREWKKDHPELLAAGLGYYALFSLAPMLIMVTALVGDVWSHPIAKLHVMDQLTLVVGTEAQHSIGKLLDITTRHGKGKATVFSMILLYFAGSQIFSQLRTAINFIWSVPPREEHHVIRIVRNSLLNFVLVVGVCAFLLLLIASETVLLFMQSSFFHYVPWTRHLHLFSSLNVILSYFLACLFFAAAYKFLPDTSLRWTDVLPGAVLTSTLFVIGKSAFSLYLAHQSFKSIYGAASSIIVTMVWIYFAAQIFFFGAEFTWLYTKRYGSKAPRDGRRATA
ncbi:MAG TPA: YihY/virulence factor BrkB family protein [Elusimicrobiota bacterium]|nr:YihY/virulence factor BrkB family protein [Elusimicrobiota bacterium]